jgi:adenosine kinase
VTNLGAARLFKESYLDQEDVISLVSLVQFLYISGYFLSNGLECAFRLAKAAAEARQTVVLNLAAPYIATNRAEELEKILLYVDIVIGNDTEYEAWGANNTPQVLRCQ